MTAGLVAFLARITLALGLLVAALLLLTQVTGGDPTDVRTLVVRVLSGVLLSVFVLAMILVLARRVDRRPLRDFGLCASSDAGRAFCTGLLAWLLPAAVVFAILGLTGTPLAVHGSLGEVMGIGVLLVSAVLLTEAIPEEMVFRGYVTAVLGERLHGWWIISVQAALFTGFALVLRGFTGIADLSMFIGMGIGLGYLRLITGAVWTTIGFHTAFQTGSQAVLTQDIVSFSGSADLAMLALGAIPFAAGIIMVSLSTSLRTEPAR